MINNKSSLSQKFWQDGAAMDCPIIDFHAHMHSFNGSYMPMGEPEQMIELMNRCNVILAVFASHYALWPSGKYIDADRQTAEKYSDKFKAYYTVAAESADYKTDLKAMDEHSDVFTGFKFHSSTHKYPINSSFNTPYFEYADQNKLLVLAHTWKDDTYNGPKQVEDVLKKYSDLVFLAGHSFCDDWDAAIELAGQYPNLYLELTAVLPHRGALERFVDEVGSDRVLFGCDMPWFSYYHSIGAILSADIKDDDRRNIFYKNGLRLLERFSWFNDLLKRAAAT